MQNNTHLNHTGLIQSIRNEKNEMDTALGNKDARAKRWSWGMGLLSVAGMFAELNLLPSRGAIGWPTWLGCAGILVSFSIVGFGNDRVNATPRRLTIAAGIASLIIWLVLTATSINFA